MKREKELLAKTLLGSPQTSNASRTKIGLHSQQLPRVKPLGIDKDGNGSSMQESQYFGKVNTPSTINNSTTKQMKRVKSQNEMRTNSLSNYTTQIQQILEKIDDPEFSETRTKSDALYQIKSQNLFMQGPLSMKARDLGITQKAFKRNMIFPPKVVNDSNQNSNTESQSNTSPMRQQLSNRGNHQNPLVNESNQRFFIRNNFSQDQSPNKSIKANPSNRYNFASPKGSIDNLMRNIQGTVGFNSNFSKKSLVNNQLNELNKQINSQLHKHLRSLSQEGYLKDQISQEDTIEKNNKPTDFKVNLGSEKEIQLGGSMMSQTNYNNNFNIDDLREGISKTLQMKNSKKNMYTSYDTRFSEIRKLNNDNQKLKNQIQDIQNELEDMDEFKIALEHQQRAEDLHEMRFDLLKAQISRQQKHIRRLTGMLQGSRKVVKEVLSICQFFADIIMRQKNEVLSNEQNAINQQLASQNGNKVQNNQQQQEGQNENNMGPVIVYPENMYLPGNEEGIIMQLEKKLMNLSLKNLLNNFGSTEERDNFVNNFYSAYHKIVEYERSNKEFSSIFAIKDQKRLVLPDSYHGSLTNLDKSAQNSQIFQEAFQQVAAIGQGVDSMARKDPNKKNSLKHKVKYKYPVKEFIEKYKDYIPINTIFSSFPSQQKDNLNNMVNVLQGILKKCEKGFKQVRQFQLYKSNPFLYIDKRNRVDLPDTLLNYKSDFETYMKYRDKMTSINLSHEQLMKTESSLSQLLSNILSVYQQVIVDNKYNPSQEISNLVNSMRKSIEQMICLGVMLNRDAGSNNARYLIVAQNISSDLSLNTNKYSDKQNQSQNWNDTRDEQNVSKYLNQSNLDQLQINMSQNKSPKMLASPDDSQLGSQNLIQLDNNAQSKRKQKLLQKNVEQQKLQQKLLDELKDYEQLRTLKLDKDADCNADFFDRHQICENIFDDLYKNIKIGEVQDSINLALKLGTIIHKMKSSFEMKNNILLVKEMQIDYLKNQIYVYKQDIIQCNYFIDESQEAINNFFTPINSKLNQILTLFNSVMDGSKQSDPKSRKNFILTFKKNLKEILELIKRIEDKNYPIDQLNIKQLKDAFHQKVDLACMKHENIRKHLQS